MVEQSPGLTCASDFHLQAHCHQELGVTLTKNMDYTPHSQWDVPVPEAHLGSVVMMAGDMKAQETHKASHWTNWDRLADADMHLVRHLVDKGHTRRKE